MKFCEFTAHTNTIASELVADIFWDYTTYGVAICDVADAIELQKSSEVYWDYIDDEVMKDSGEVLVKCYVPENEALKTFKELEQRLCALKKLCEYDTGSLELVRRTVDGDEWIEIWKKHFRAINIGNVVICPDWIKYEKKAGETVVLIGSNMAFGTGEHETTSMCIELMQNYLKREDIVSDIGCGSGILGISALLLGARTAHMTDIDSVALTSSKNNAKLNKVSEKCIIEKAGEEKYAFESDITFANITAEVLVRLSERINGSVKPGGYLILSGIIDSRLELVLNHFIGLGFSHEKTLSKGGWNALAFKKAD